MVLMNVKKVLTYACKHGYTDVINDVDPLYIKKNVCEMFYTAIQYNHLTLGKWLYNWDEHIDFDCFPDNIFNKVKYKDIETYKWLILIHPSLVTRENVAIAFNIATDYCNFAVFKWLYNEFPQYKAAMIDIMYEGVIYDDGDNTEQDWSDKNLDCLKYLYEQDPDYILDDDLFVIQICEKPNINMMKWFFEIYDERNIVPTNHTLYGAIKYALELEDMTLAIFLYGRIENGIKNMMENYCCMIFTNLCHQNNVTLCKSLYQSHFITIRLIKTCLRTVQCYKLDILKWVHTIDDQIYNTQIPRHVCVHFISTNSLEIWQYLKSLTPQLGISNYIYLLKYACEHGTVEMFRWLYSYKTSSSNWPTLMTECIKLALTSCNIAVYRELLNMDIQTLPIDYKHLFWLTVYEQSNNYSFVQVHKYLTWAIINDRENGTNLFDMNTDVEIPIRRIPNVDGFYTISNLFPKLCDAFFADVQQDITVCKILYSKTNDANRKKYIIRSLNSCSIYDLYVYKWLYSKYVELDLEDCLYELFMNLIACNKLIILQWLVETSKYEITIDECDLHMDEPWLYKDTINSTVLQWLHDNTDICKGIIFKYAFANNSLKLCKQIYTEHKSLVDIRHNNDEMFKYCCKYNYVALCKWIISLYPDIYKIISLNVDNIKYIIFTDLNSVKLVCKNDLTDCSICYEKSDIIATCNHQFCKYCLNVWLTNNPDICPMCRANIKYDECSKIEIKN